jgi:hypothetical protein
MAASDPLCFTSPAQLLMHFSIAKGDNLVSSIQPSLLFKTIKRDQLLENSISSSYLLDYQKTPSYRPLALDADARIAHLLNLLLEL